MNAYFTLIPGEVRGRFPRNTVSSRYGCQLVAHGPGAALQVRNDAATMPFIVGRSAWIAIGQPKSQGIVEKDGNLAGRRRHGLLLADAPCQPSVKRAEGDVTSPDRGSSQPQQCCRSTGRATGSG